MKFSPKDSGMAYYTIKVSKEYFKFSAAHFTIFNDSEVEKLHGHNYRVRVEIKSRNQQQGLIIEFRQLKNIIKQLCDSLDERILLPSESPLLKIVKENEQFHVVFNGAGFTKEYRFPCEDVEILPVINITVEMLAQYICESLTQKLLTECRSPDHAYPDSIISIEVEIEESTGQSVSYVWEN
jgi:6-pyruvoyltetrahydropterin/6-carboxytetrahydropterin synthase